MNYGIEIKENNQRPHIDIEKDIAERKNGLFTFIIKVNNGNIVDYVVVEYADARKYLRLKEIIIEQFTITSDIGVGDNGDPIRTDNG